jgi:rSAM-partnered protein
MSDSDGTRTPVDDPRRDGVREWEVFVASDATEALRHVGSVSAPTAEAAHKHAGTLFPDTETLWLCPTDEVARFSTRTLGARPEDSTEADA